MNILIVTGRIPYPPFRGDKLKIYNLATRLAKNHAVEILCLGRQSESSDAITKLQESSVKLTIIRFPIWKSILSVLLRFLTGLPLQVLWYYSKGLQQALAKRCSEKQPDVVYFHLIRSATYQNAVPPHVLRVIDYTDSVSLYLSRMAEITPNIFKRMLFLFEKQRIQRYESVANSFDHLFICSPVDKTHLVTHCSVSAPVSELPNGVDLGSFGRKDSVRPEQNRIIFTGNMPYFPNQDAAEFAARLIMPRVWKLIPEAHLFLVGQNPPKTVKNLASEKITVTGFVQDIASEYQKSQVTIAPVRFGAGTLNKVIESLVLGVPVVSTSKAVAGLPGVLKPYVHLAETETEFAERIAEILNNPSRFTQIASEGARIAQSELNWDTIVGHFERKLQTLLAEKVKHS